MSTAIDLSPDRDPGDLIDALYKARRENRRDLQRNVERLLEHDDPMVREEALSLLFTKWEDRSRRDKVVELLLYDQDDGVRARAAIGLASIASQASSLEDANLLAHVFAEDGVSSEIRRACVEALSLMAGRPAIVEIDDTGPKKVNELLAQIVERKGR